jgi:NAD-dependent dihydropyrimidine dehydrogenase PreA subunit
MRFKVQRSGLKKTNSSFQKDDVLIVDRKPFHQMGFGGYSEFWSLLWVMPIGWNLWTLNLEPISFGYSMYFQQLGVVVMPKVLRDYEVYLVYVDSDRCDSCEECVIMCPTDVFEMPHKAIPVRPQNCLGCLTCTAVCKSKAIIITEI